MVAHDPDAMAALLGVEFLYEDVPSRHECRSLEQLREFFDMTFTFSPNFAMEVRTSVLAAEGGHLEWVMTGDHQEGEQSSSFAVRGATIWVIEDGVIVRNSDYWDLHRMMRQCKLLPALGTSAHA